MIRLKSLLLEKTLYHGTTKVAVKEIEKYGICPMVGAFIKNSYGCDYDEKDLKELIFATDKEQLGKAVGAITAQVTALLNKTFHDVTDQEFINCGAIIKIYDGEGLFQRRDKEKDGFYDEHPPTVEPGDYYSEEGIRADEILIGNPMIRLLKRYGEWPRDFGKDEKKNRKELLIRMAIKHHKDIPKSTVIKHIMSLSPADINKYFYKYKNI